MKAMKKKREGASLLERRRFMGLMGGGAAVSLTLLMSRWRRRPEELDLREADFYKRHDLAG